MSNVQQNGCGCCGTAGDSTGTAAVAGSAARVRFVAGAEQSGIAGDDLTDLVAAFDRGDCPATRPRMADLAEVRLAAALPDGARPDLVCTLDGGLDAMRGRIGEWKAVIARASGREPADGGVTLVYDHDPAVTVELARLAAAEFACCSFFTFAVTVAPEGLRFTISAPDEARDVVAAVFGTATPAPVGLPLDGNSAGAAAR